MWFDWPKWAIALVNSLGVPAVHFGMAWLFTKMPRSWFVSGKGIFREWPRESVGFYDRVFQVRRWKELLPDAAPWFGGFAKKRLAGRDREFYEEFRDETCRSEAAHHAQVIGISLFYFLNPWPWSLLLPLYAVLSNLPCILLQRQNRLRLTRILRSTPVLLREAGARIS